MNELQKFVSNFTDEEIPAVYKKGREYYLVPAKVEQQAKKISRDPSSIGLYLGEEKNKKFMASPALLELIAKKSEVKVFVGEKAEWLFLCGRDVFEKSMFKMNVKTGIVLVQNKRDENIGLGKLDKEKGSILLTNLLDRGDYLRREQ